MDTTTPKIFEGHQAVMPYLIVRDAAGLIKFLELTFGAREISRQMRDEKRIRHAEVSIFGSTLMIADATTEFTSMPAGMFINVADTDATYHRALNLGATTALAPMDSDYGARSAGVTDPFGNTWWINTFK